MENPGGSHGGGQFHLQLAAVRAKIGFLAGKASTKIH
jgi:hypothetical protein